MGVARLYRVGSPYNGEELSEVDFEQSADTMYIAHWDHAPTKLVRRAHDDWEFVTITFGPLQAAPTGTDATATNPNVDSENDGNAYFPQPASYVVTAVNDASGQESRASTSDSATNDLTLKRNYNTITWTAATDADRYRIFKADNQQDYGYIGTTDQLTFRDDNIGPDLSDAPPVGDNPFDGEGNYPSTVTFFEQRLMWGRTKNRPNAIWGSKSGDYENMDIARPLRADDALSFALVAGRVNAVNQLVSIDSLLALTSDSIFKITGSNDDYLAATPPPRSRRQIGRGSSRLSPLVIDNVTFYAPSVGNSVRTLGYSFDIDSIKSDDISIFSPHFFANLEIVSWAYAQEPRSVIWAARSDGKLLCFTWEQEQQVWGWTLCETDGLVESVAVISEAENGVREDRLYLTVRRAIGGVDKVYIERMAAVAWEEIDDCCFTDCSVTYEFEEAQTVLGNLHHLEGETLTGVADGNVVSGLVVEDGQVTIGFPATRVTVGLPFEARIETLPLIMSTREGSNVAKKQQVGQVVIRVVRSRGLRVGPNDANIYRIKPRANEDYGSPVALATGDYEVDAAPVVSGETKVVITSPEPLPMLITGVALEPIITG
jgi:hypothetical protein